MAQNRGLKTRGNLSSTVNLELIEWLKQHSKDTRIPMSRLLDESIDDLKKKNNPSAK